MGLIGVNEKLLKLLYDYSSRGKLADRYFVCEIINIFANEFQLQNYLVSERFQDCDLPNRSIAGYCYGEKKIYIYTDVIREESQRYNKKYGPYMSKINLVYLKNLAVMQTVLHELEHALQAKKVKEEDSEEARILRITGIGASKDYIAENLLNLGMSMNTINIFLNQKTDKYRMLHDYTPNERLAELNSYARLLEMTSSIRECMKPAYARMERKLTETQLYGYKQDGLYISPTIFYLEQQGEHLELQKFAWYDPNPVVALNKAQSTFNLEKRIKLGLPISKSEYKAREKLLVLC